MAMTLRSVIQVSGLLLSICATLVGAWSLYEAFPHSKEILNLQTISLVALGVILTIVSLMLMLSFRNTPNPEVTFYVLGMQALAFHALRPTILALVNKGTVWTITATLTRFIHFGNMLFVLSLFVSGLFAAGLALQRRTILLTTSFFIAFILSALIPIDISQFSQRMLFRSGLDTGILIGSVIISLLAVVNFIMASIQQEEKKHLTLGAGVLLSLTGGFFIFYLPFTYASPVGILLIIIGSYLFGSRTHQIYLWL